MRKILASCFATLLILTASASPAQYRMQSMQDFETGGTLGLPEGLLHGHNSTPLTTRIMALSDAVEKGIITGEPNADILGEKVLHFAPVEEEPHLSVVYNAYLNREKLGSKGVALMQVDVYLPATGVNHHTVSILASAHDPEYGKSKRGYRFYRLGMQTDRVYFSFTNAKASPDIYHRQDIGDFNLTRPGWHRLQMAFHADGNIHCYIDGNEANFSPIQETTLMEVNPGIMVTRYMESEGVMLTDNLSMMWSGDPDAPLPLSPWRDSDADAYAGNIDWENSGVAWETRFSDAWHQARNENKHILVFLHDADEVANNYGLQLLGAPEAQKFLKFVVPLRMNAATDYGKQISDQIGVTSIPAFVVLKPDGVPFSKAELVPNQTTWDDIQSVITKPAT